MRIAGAAHGAREKIPMGLAEYSQGQLLHACDFTDRPSILSIDTPAEKPTPSTLMPKAPIKSEDFDWSA